MADDPVPARARDQNSEEDRAIDSLAYLLRTLGRFSLDLDQKDAAAFAERCEAWARHLLLRVAAPSVTPGAAQANLERDYAGLCTFFTDNRRREAEYVRGALSDLRNVIAAFVHSLHRALPEEEEADNRARSAMERLQEAVASDSIEEIKRAAAHTVTTIEEILARRRKRQESQMAELGTQLKTLSKRLEAAERESQHDPLTNLGNRRLFDEQLARAVDLNGFFQEPACLLLIDIDHFKAVNDRYGHPSGDVVLKKLADTLAKTFPRRGDCVARHGGEEFAVVLRDAELGDARRLGERLLTSVRGLAIQGTQAGQEIRITVSAGLAAVRLGEASWHWLERADRALYRAKHEGRDRLMEADD